MANGPKTNLVAQRLDPKPVGWLGRRLKVTIPPDMVAFRCRELADASIHLEPWREKDEHGDPRDVLLAVSRQPFELGMVFADLPSRDGSRLTVRFSIVVRAAAPERFILAYNPRRIAWDADVSQHKLADFVLERAIGTVAQSVADWSFHDLKARRAITSQGWLERLSEALSDPMHGDLPVLQIDHLDVLDYESTEAEAAYVRAQREAERQRRLAEDKLALEHEAAQLRLAEQRREVERRLAEEEELTRIEDQARQIARMEDLRMQKAVIERQSEAEELEHKIALEKLQAEFAAQQSARIEAENQRLRHEKQAERLREGGAEQEAEAAALRAQIEAARARLASLNNTIAEMERFRDLERVIRREDLPDPHGAALRHAGLGAAALHQIAGTTQQRLAALVRQRQEMAPEACAISRPLLTARDLGIVRLDTIEIGMPFEMTIRTARGGWLTLLNFGTSGRAMLLAPNNLAGLARSRLDAGTTEAMPGERLLPGAVIKERGPPGSQEVVALLTETPIFDEAEITAVATANYVLPKARLSRLLEQLDTMPLEAWYGAVLGVTVLDPATRQ